MINLLPYETKQETRAARINVILLRYIIILGISFVFVVLICVGTYFFLNNNKTATEEVIDSTASPSSIQVQADAFRSNLTLSKNILDQQVSYSNTITGIATNLPSGTRLDSIFLDGSSFGSTLNLAVRSTSAEKETELKAKFQSSPLFSDYKFQKTDSNLKDSKYPFTINISFTINKGLAQ